MSDTNDDLVFETTLDAPPDKVWRALTIPEYLERWLDRPESVEQLVGIPPAEVGIPFFAERLVEGGCICVGKLRLGYSHLVPFLLYHGKVVQCRFPLVATQSESWLSEVKRRPLRLLFGRSLCTCCYMRRFGAPARV